MNRRNFHAGSAADRIQRYLLLAAVIFSTMLLNAATALAQETGASVENNPYFVALLQIGLQKEQVPAFKDLISRYASDRQDAIDRELRRREGSLQSRVRRAKARLQSEFFAEMEQLLNDEQFSRFPAFHEELDKMLLERESLVQDNDTQGIFPNQT